MLKNRLNIDGIDALDNEMGKYFICKEHSVFSLVKLFLYCLGDIEWIEGISWHLKEQAFELMFYVKEDIGTEGLEEIMIITVEQVKKHLEDIGLATVYGPENPVRTIMARLLVSPNVSIKFWLIQRGRFRREA